MSLYIATSAGEKIAITDWHSGGAKLSDAIKDISLVIIVRADGDELELIRSRISGIRMANNRVVHWVGDDARFIVENL